MDTRSHYETDRHTSYQVGGRSGRMLTLFAMAVAMLSFYSSSIHASRPIMLVDQSCVISVLNRTVQADEKGAFRLDNVPSFLGKVRARATCTRNGDTFSGESDYFDIPLNGFVRVSQFYEMVDELTPNKLRVLGDQSITMTGVDSVKRLTVLADYPNGSIKPVTAGIWGTNYTSSNPSTVTVDVNGVLRANSPGRALITVRKDGVITVVTANVVTSGDRDNDGIPDEVELANGLDPDDPVDALEDQDGDGLTAIKEYSEGTEINNADTDGDGIPDGEELVAGADGYITNPLLEDSDGDGINDKLEMDLGSDPTDINDAPYVDAMTGLSVTPESALLFYNTIDNESSFQLTVEGEMVDGSKANLTPLSRGTTYSSSDLDIASFSGVPGRVFAGIDGDATVTAANNGFTADSHVSVLSYAPVPLGTLQLPFKTSNVALTNDYAYVAGIDGELAIVSFADAANIRIEGMVDVASDAIDVLVNGGFAYVLTANRLMVVDVSDVVNPVVVKNMPLVGITGFDIKGNYLYISAGFNLYVLSVTSPGNPVLINTKALEESALDVKTGDILAINTGVEILAYSLLSAVNPQLIGRQAIVATAFAVKGESVLVAGTASNYPTIDFSDPSSPVLTVPTVGGFSSVDVAVAGEHAFYADKLFVGGVIPYVNVEDIRNPIYQGIIDFRFYSGGSCFKIASTLSHSVCTNGNRVVITQQRQVQDLAGIAPTVTLLAPLNDLTLYQDRPYRFSFNVIDDERVATVLYYVNDELITTDSSAPYEFIYRLPVDGSELIVRTDALDMAGNLGSSDDILFIVEPLSGAADEIWRGVSIDYLEDDLLSGSIVMEGSSLLSDFAVTTVGNFRSEERRVGKECRSRWSPYH